MGLLANLSAGGGALDSSSSLLSHLNALKADPKNSVAYAQVNADLQNLAAAATSVIPGVGGSFAFVALSANITLILTKAVNGSAPNTSDLLAVGANVITIVGQVITAAGLGTIVITGGVGVVPGGAAITIGTGVDALSAAVTAASLGVDYNDVKSLFSNLSTELKSLSAASGIGANSGLITNISSTGAIVGVSPPNSDNNVAANPVTPPANFNTPARVSSSYVSAGANSNSVTLSAGGTASDIWLTQKNAGNVWSNPQDFYDAVLASNPSITNINKIPAGAVLYIPQKLPDGSISYNMAGGITVNTSATTGTYNMVVPANDGSGNVSIYGKTVDPSTTGGFNLSQVTTKNGQVISGSNSQQDASGNLSNTTSYVQNTNGGFDYVSSVSGGHTIGYSTSLNAEANTVIGPVTSIDGTQINAGAQAALTAIGITPSSLQSGSTQIAVSADGSTVSISNTSGQLQTSIVTAPATSTVPETTTQTNYTNPGDSNIRTITNRDAAGNITDKTTVAAAMDANGVVIPNSYLTTTTTISGDTNGVYTQVDRSFDAQGNLTSTATTSRATPGGELTTTVDSKVGDNDVSVTYSYDANKTPVVQSLNSINGQTVDVATSDAFVLQANIANSQNTNTSTQDPVTLTQSLGQAILPTLNVNVNNVDTAVSTTVSTTGTVDTVTLTDGSNVNLTSGNQYVSTTTAPPVDSSIAIDVPAPSTPVTGNTAPSTSIINGDGTYAYSLPTAAGGTQTISDNSDGSAVVNNYTSSGTLIGSGTTGFNADSRKRYKDKSCLRPYLFGCSTKTCLKTAQKCKKRAPIKTSHSKPKLAQTTLNLGKKHNQKCLLIDIRRNRVRIKTSIQKETI